MLDYNQRLEFIDYLTDQINSITIILKQMDKSKAPEKLANIYIEELVHFTYVKNRLLKLEEF